MTFVILSNLTGNVSISVFRLVLWNLWEISQDTQHANYWLGKIASNANRSIGNVVASHSLSLMKARQVRCKRRPVRRYTFEIALQGFTFLNWVNENITKQWHKISPKMSIFTDLQCKIIICTSALWWVRFHWKISNIFASFVTFSSFFFCYLYWRKLSYI